MPLLRGLSGLAGMWGVHAPQLGESHEAESIGEGKRLWVCKSLKQHVETLPGIPQRRSGIHTTVTCLHVLRVSEGPTSPNRIGFLCGGLARA